MRSVFAYKLGPGPLGSAGPGAAAAYLGVLAVVALTFANPIVIAGAGVAVVVTGLVSSAGASLATAARWALSLGVLILVVNALVVRRGDTVLVRGFDLPVLGPIDITLEALGEGAVLGLRVVVVLLAFAVFSACVDPDRMLGALRPIARRSALTATLITRLVPLTGRDHARLREAASFRGPAAAPVGRAASARRLLAGSLDRAADVAATLELRGYGLAPPSRVPRERRGRARTANRSSLLLLALAGLTTGVAVGARLAGIGSFNAYPTIQLDSDPAALALALAIPLLALLLLFRRSAKPRSRWALSQPSADVDGFEPGLAWGGDGLAQATDPVDVSNGRPPPKARDGGAVLALEELAYRYPGAEHDAIDDLNFAVSDGELVLLAGASGSGKTSLLRVACGLIPHFHGGAISGRARIGGHDLRECGPSELAAVAGFVAQDPETQVVSALAGSELELPLSARGQAPDLRTARLIEVASELGIAHLLERTSDSLSAGELQRVAIAAAMVSSPRLLLLDEPTSQLDPGGAQELEAVVLRVCKLGTAVVLAEHRLERWLPVADRVAVMDRGALVFDGPPTEADLGGLTSAGLAPAREGAVEHGLPQCRTGRVQTRNGTHAQPPVGSEPALELRDVSVELAQRPGRVLDGVELSIDRGERVALAGANGAGKSTLLRVCAGAIEPSGGRLSARHGVALLGQHPGDYIVREQVADELPGASGEAALAAVGLSWASELDPRDLSGGERQRLALAVALAGRGIGGKPPGLVCLDEPTRGMDLERKEELAGLIRHLSERGAAVLVATHDFEFAGRFAERAIVLDQGRIVADGGLDQLVVNDPLGFEPLFRGNGRDRSGESLGNGPVAAGRTT